MTKINKVRDDVELESLLGADGYVWTIEKVASKKVDLDASKEWQVRLRETVDPDLCEDYTQAKLKGKIFPRALAVKTPGGRYLVPCGVHRTVADIEGCKVSEVEFYVIDVDDESALKGLAVAHNRCNGDRPKKSKAQAMTCAVQDVENGRRTQDGAADYYSLSKYTVAMYCRINKVDKRLVKLGIDPLTLDGGARDAMHQLENLDDEVVREVALLASTPLFNVGLVKELCGRVLKCRSGGIPAKMAVINEYKKTSPGAGGPQAATPSTNGHADGRRRLPPGKSKLLGWVAKGISMLKAHRRSLSAYGITGAEERKKVCENIETLVGLLVKLEESGRGSRTKSAVGS